MINPAHIRYLEELFSGCEDKSEDGIVVTERHYDHYDQGISEIRDLVRTITRFVCNFSQLTDEERHKFVEKVNSNGD